VGERLRGKPERQAARGALNGAIFHKVAGVRVLIERWREHYNRVRPHSALGYPPPTALEAIAAGSPSASLRAVKQTLPIEMTTAIAAYSTAAEGHESRIGSRRVSTGLKRSLIVK